MTDTEMQNKQQFKLTTQQRNRENLITCGVLLISQVSKEFYNDPHFSELLHSIFFFTNAQKPPLEPNELLPEEMASKLQKDFPEPFTQYKTHLPKRTPFSVLLMMMELKHNSEEEVMEKLRELLEKLKFPYPQGNPKYKYYYTLESKTICVCFNEPLSSTSSTAQGSKNESLSSKKYFGACIGLNKDKDIVIYSSCVNDVWHEYVSHAVMSFRLQPVGDSLVLPTSVRCKAYSRNWETNTFEERRPCWQCHQLFNLANPEVEQGHSNPYGNCAETECLSKLLQNDQSVRDSTKINNHTEETMRQLKENANRSLKEKLALIPAFRVPVFNP